MGSCGGGCQLLQKRNAAHMQRTSSATALACLLWWVLDLLWTAQQQSWVGVYCIEEGCLCHLSGWQ